MKRSVCLDRKLALYTLAATAVAATPQMMKADGITYVPNVNQTTSYSFNTTTSTSTSSPDVVVTFPGNNQTLSFNTSSIGIFAQGSTGVSFLQDSDGDPAALGLGALIDPTASSSFATNGKLVSSGKAGSLFGAGNFPLNGEAYLGFYFTETDGLHAGWADLGTTGTQDGNNYSLTLKSYAYQNTANASILAGQTVAATPEPASISLIAMGAAGLAELRRRRRKYAEAA